MKPAGKGRWRLLEDVEIVGRSIEEGCDTCQTRFVSDMEARIPQGRLCFGILLGCFRDLQRPPLATTLPARRMGRRRPQREDNRSEHMPAIGPERVPRGSLHCLQMPAADLNLAASGRAPPETLRQYKLPTYKLRRSADHHVDGQPQA